MKFRNLLFGCFLVLSSFSAYAGGENSGGGDPDEIEFRSLGFQIASILEAKELSEIMSTPAPDLLRSAVSNTRILMSDKPLFLDGQRREAINHPSRSLIEVFRPSYHALTNETKRHAFILHEYLGILSLTCGSCDDRDYRISSRFLRTRTEYLNANFKNPEPPKLVCTTELSEKSTDFLQALLLREAIFGGENGEIQQITITQNAMGYYLGHLRDSNGQHLYPRADYPLHECQDIRSPMKRTYIRIYGDRYSPSGTYSHELYVLIPVYDDFLASKTLPSWADLRWGQWMPIKIRLK